MFSVLVLVVRFFNFSKSKVTGATEKAKQQFALRKKLFSSGDNGVTLADKSGIISEGKKLAGRVLTLISLITAFFEAMAVFLSMMTWGMYLLLGLLMIVLVIIVMSMIDSLLHVSTIPKFNFNPHNVTPVSADNALNWTSAQLAADGGVLTEYQKNLYRLGILANQAINSYGTSLFNIPNASNNEKIKMLIGVASTETAMQFYNPGQEYNIMRVPSDIADNSLGYGFLGLNSSDSLRKEGLSSSYIAALRRAYPTPNPAPVSDALFAPWGMAMVAAHEGREFSELVQPNVGVVVDQVAAAFGIKSNLQQFKTYVDFFLTQAQYNGAYISDYKAYVSFYAALFSATAQGGSTPTFDAWSLAPSGNNFSEAAIRASIDGEIGGEGFSFTPSAPSSPDRLTGLGALGIYLNGHRLTVPVWKYVWNVIENGAYSSEAKQDLAEAWVTATNFSSTDNTMLLNFYYGFNSFLEGNRIESILAKKMGILLSTSGNFKATPGKGQAVINGDETTLQYINKWERSPAGNPSLYQYITKVLEPTWGTSAYLTDPNDPAKIGGDIGSGYAKGYVDKVHGVPFYGQDGYGVNYGEAYSNLDWYPNNGNNTFAYSGCMLYATAYAASALTGRLINPAEMDSIMLTTGAIQPAGIAMSEMPKTYALLGLKASLIPGGASAWGSPSSTSLVGTSIASTVKAGGVAIIFTDKPPFTTGTHFIALTAVKTVNGVNEYTIYTSPRFDQSEVPWSQSTILSAEIDNEPVLLVWK